MTTDQTGSNGAAAAAAAELTERRATSEEVELAALGMACADGPAAVGEVVQELSPADAARLLAATMPAEWRLPVAQGAAELPPGAVRAVLAWVSIARTSGFDQGYRAGLAAAKVREEQQGEAPTDPAPAGA